MKNSTATKVILVIGFISAVILLSLIGLRGVVARRSGIQSRGASERELIRDALRRGGLREAAKIKGHYVGSFDPHWDFSQLNIEELTRSSAAVIVGAPTKSLGGRLAAEGQLIFTDYEVSVQEVIKGAVESGGVVKVSLVGGLVEFEDGTSAELKTPSFEHVRPGRTYTFFLSERDAASEAYSLTAGPQGLVEIVDGTKVKSHGRPTDPVAEESKDKDRNSFLKEVRKQAERWPQPGKCCN